MSRPLVLVIIGVLCFSMFPFLPLPLKVLEVQGADSGIVILSPQNTAYDVTPVSLTFTVSNSTFWIGYSLNDQGNITIGGNTTLTGLSAGQYDVVIFANETSMSDWDIRNLAMNCAFSLTPPLSSDEANELIAMLISENTTSSDLLDWYLTSVPFLNQDEVASIMTVYQTIAHARSGNIVSSEVVNFTVVQPRTIIVPDDYPTIQAAINAASDGDTVFVRNGTYYENVVVNKAVSLFGEDKQMTSIDGNNTGYCVRTQSNGTIIENFTIENGDLVDIRVNQNVSAIVENNIVANSNWGIYLGRSLNCTIEGNRVENCSDTGIFLESSSYNTLVGNTLVNNHEGIVLTAAPHLPEVPPVPSRFNTVSHNNLVNNTFQAISSGFGNLWDDGYPSGGNYWSDYSGLDKKCGPCQDHPGSDGIGDTPYTMDSYPLMNPWTPPAGHSIAVVAVVSKTVVFQGFIDNMTVYAANMGEYPETFNATVYADTTEIASTVSPLENGSTPSFTLCWNTTSFAKGNYSLNAYAEPVPGETYMADNNFTGGWVMVSMVGDLTGPIPGVPEGTCDIRDIALVAKAFGSTPGTLGWNPNCNITGPTPGVPDDKVDIRDIAIVAKHFGESALVNVLLVTSMGNMTIELYDDMPITTGNFENLVRTGVYDGTIFHRIVPGFVIQGGDATLKGVTVPPIQDELPNKHSNIRGSIAMAKTILPNSATSQFFINLNDTNAVTLDSNYSVFGTVIAGMDVVDAISHVPISPPTDGKPLTDVTLIVAQLVS